MRDHKFSGLKVKTEKRRDSVAKKATVTFVEPNLDGGALHVWAEGEGTAYGDFVGDSTITLFQKPDTGAFVCLKAPDPREVPEHIEAVRAVPLEPIDVPAAGLYGVHPAEALLWGYEHLYPKYPSYTAAELSNRLAAIGPNDL